MGLQNFSEKPILVGADVSALYPSLKKEVAGEMIYRATVQCDIKFSGINFDHLSVYLFLVLGAGIMSKCGLGRVIPTRRSKTNARSLLSPTNRDQNEWITKPHEYTQDVKKRMMGRMLQILTIVLMSSSCYSFGGKIYRQKEGAGIGERGSACIARTVMSLWDKIWAAAQSRAGLVSPLFIRYVDDIRIYMHPINQGWKWTGICWEYDKKYYDDLTYEERTKQNVLQSLNGLLEGIILTVESASDFSNGMLPTLDFQTRVRSDGEVEHLHYTKPMASGLVIQYGTALGQQTIFASLRQDLIRRLSHISDHFGIKEQKALIENFTQSLANSGHSYSFTKSVILQALTRYKCMKLRSNLDTSDIKYFPFYRDRWHDFDKRKMIKGTLGRTWYTGVNYGDKYKQEWKRKIKRKGGKIKPKNRGGGSVERPSTVMFVPSTAGGTLLNMLNDLEYKLHERGDVSWTVKLVEKAGKPLRSLFGIKIPIVDGCPLGENCTICENDTIKCSIRGVVYLAECGECKTVGRAGGEDISQFAALESSWYVGETSRPVRMRANEHLNNLLELNTDSFMLTHWMNKHGFQMVPPEYKFKLLGCYKDPLSRQIAEAVFIEERGKLNRRSEFGVNHLHRLEVARSEKERDILLEKENRQRANLVSDLLCFKSVILKVYGGKFKSSTCRSKQQKRNRQEEEEECKVSFGGTLEGKKSKRRKEMFPSTPIWTHRSVDKEESSPESIENSPLLNSSCEALVGLIQSKTPESLDGDGKLLGDCNTLKTAGLTPQLKKLLIHPLNEDEYLSTRRFLQETINLTKTAILNGLIIEDLDTDEYILKLGENYL